MCGSLLPRRLCVGPPIARCMPFALLCKQYTTVAAMELELPRFRPQLVGDGNSVVTVLVEPLLGKRAANECGATHQFSSPLDGTQAPSATLSTSLRDTHQHLLADSSMLLDGGG